jgi:hypothetical protein
MDGPHLVVKMRVALIPLFDDTEKDKNSILGAFGRLREGSKVSFQQHEMLTFHQLGNHHHHCTFQDCSLNDDRLRHNLRLTTMH